MDKAQPLNELKAEKWLGAVVWWVLGGAASHKAQEKLPVPQLLSTKAAVCVVGTKPWRNLAHWRNLTKEYRRTRREKFLPLYCLSELSTDKHTQNLEKGKVFKGPRYTFVE